MNAFRWFYQQPYLLLFLATLIWAGNAVAGKIAVGHISPFLLTTLRWLLAVAIVLPLAARYLQRDWKEIEPHLVFLFLLGSTGFALFNNLMYLALTTTTALNVAIIQSSLPLFVFLLNFLLYRAATTGFQAVGFPLTMMGVMIITTQGSWQVLQGLLFNVGDVMMIIAVLIYGAYSVLLNNKPDIHWLSLLTVLCCSALITSLPFAVYEHLDGTANWPDQTGLMVVLYTGLFASLLAQAFWIRGIELIGANATSMFINLVPLLGTLLAVLILGEHFQNFHAVGMGLILFGVMLAQRNSRSSEGVAR
ncbi:MAG: DMT family transporter [Pseudomonadota bacterium]